MSRNVVIVGGGVSGLATAYYLGQLGIRSTVIEKLNRLGGLIKTDLAEGCQLEAGPDSYIATKPSVTDLASELGLIDQIIESNDARRRIFVIRSGKLIPMPQGMVMMIPGKWGPVFRSELFGVQTKLRFLLEPLSRPRCRREDVSVGQFVRDHFGNEVLAYSAEPLLSGVYGGDSAALSAESVFPRFVEYERRYGSLIRGVRGERLGPRTNTGSLFRSFRGGMQSLTDSLAQAITESTTVVHAEATQVRGEGGRWRVKSGEQWIEADFVVLACPSHAAAKLIEDSLPPLAGELAAIPYSSAILVTLVFDRKQLGHPLDGFGFLVPQAERQTVAAATWIGSKFPSRLPQHLAAIRAFIVGPDATNLLEASPEEVIQLVRLQFERLMGITALPLLSKVYFWPASMPQYVVGHRRRLQAIRDRLRDAPGLYLVGNAYDGVGIPDCVRLAKDVAAQIGSRGL